MQWYIITVLLIIDQHWWGQQHSIWRWLIRPIQAQKSLPHVWHARLGPVELEVLADLALHASLSLSAVKCYSPLASYVETVDYAMQDDQMLGFPRNWWRIQDSSGMISGCPWSATSASRLNTCLLPAPYTEASNTPTVQPIMCVLWSKCIRNALHLYACDCIYKGITAVVEPLYNSHPGAELTGCCREVAVAGRFQ